MTALIGLFEVGGDVVGHAEVVGVEVVQTDESEKRREERDRDREKMRRVTNSTVRTAMSQPKPHLHLPVLRATRERSAKGMHVERVDRAEVASHTAKLLSVNGVIEAGLELALGGAGRGHGLRILSTAQ